MSPDKVELQSRIQVSQKIAERWQMLVERVSRGSMADMIKTAIFEFERRRSERGDYPAITMSMFVRNIIVTPYKPVNDSQMPGGTRTLLLVSNKGVVEVTLHGSRESLTFQDSDGRPINEEDVE